MSGIVFFGTTDRERLVEFYSDRLGFELWLEQPGCTILSYDTLLVGFCERQESETGGIVTVVHETRAAVDEHYEALEDVADEPPSENGEYEIYNFFGTDPDRRSFEVQTFLHETPGTREASATDRT